MKSMVKALKTKSLNKKGFTLVEVIVVLVILAILMAIAIPALTGYIDKAQGKGAEAEARTVVTAAQTLETEAYGMYGIDRTGANFPKASDGSTLTLAQINTTVGTLVGDTRIGTSGGPEITSIAFSSEGRITNLVYTTSTGKTVAYNGTAYTVS